MSFGGGYGGYQSMGGGGFMADESPSNLGSSQQEKKKRQTSGHSIIPVSAAMLHKAQHDKVSQSFQFDDIELHQVTMVGIIREVQESATNVLYKIDDMTGDSITVRKWIDTDETQTEALKRSQCREDTYVRVYGHLKLFQDSKSIIAFSINPVKDFNEIPYHMIEIVYAFLTIKKMDSTPEDTSMVGDIRTPGGKTSNAMQGGMGDAFSVGTGSGLSGVPHQVLEAIVACTDDQGISIDTLGMQLRNLNGNQIRKAVEFLSNEGHIYSTIDEDHFRSTSM